MNIVAEKKKTNTKKIKKEKNKAFLDLAGLYKNDNLNLKEIRKQVWR
jgi:hypothetical protein